MSEARDIWTAVKEATGAERLALLSADTDRTQDYVFESAKLPEIRGASLLLRELNEGESLQENGAPAKTLAGVLASHGLPKDCIIYKGGGSFLALVPESEADELQRDIERLYPEMTGAATITCVSWPVVRQEIERGYQPSFTEDEVWDLLANPTFASWQRRVVSCYNTEATELDFTTEQFQARKSFGEWVRLMGVLLRQRKEDKPPPPFFEALPYARRCQSCQLRPADRADTDPGDTSWPRCPVCRTKVRNGRGAGKTFWIQAFQEKMYNTDALRDFYGGHSPDEIDMADNLAELGAACQGRQGYIAFLYADGDGVGDFMESQARLEDYRANSCLIEQAARRAVMQALAEELRVTEAAPAEGGVRRPIYPFEIITIGGDDVLLILPAHAALPVAARMSALFEQKAPQHPDGRPLTLSVGIAIADDHTPVRVLRDLAAELLKKSAKPYTRSSGQACIDFHVLKSQTMLGRTVAEARKLFPYTIREGVERLRLLNRPYTVPQIIALWKALETLAAIPFPRRQMYILAEALTTGRRPASLFYLYQRARLSKRESETLDAAIESIQRPRPSHDPLPWFAADDLPDYHYRTPLLDIAELYDFVAPS